MIQISQIKLSCGTERSRLEGRIRKVLHLKGDDSFSWRIVRHSVDARKKPNLFDIYSVSVSLGRDRAREQKLVKKLHDRNIIYKEETVYHFPEAEADARELTHPPIVIGSGPAGLFCTLELSRHGYRPILLERGQKMEDRIQSVEHFWSTKELNPESNIQFGEGGAGTFSDGKLTTGVKDKSGRNARVMKTFIEAGAPEDIAYENLPHIGTDVLREVIVNLRNQIIALGGEVRFETKVTDILEEEGHVIGVEATSMRDGSKEVIPAEVVVLAPGHSARDTIRVLHKKSELHMTQKAFAIGFRVSHPQAVINHQQYGLSDPKEMERLNLPAVSYKLTAKASSGRGVYSFCMCPGGYVVNASSEKGRLCVNGMSDYHRDSARANSAIVMTVGGEEFGSEDVLAGLHFQEKLEEKAYKLAEGFVPVEQYGEFKDGFESGEMGDVSEISQQESRELCIKGLSAKAPLHALLSKELTTDFIEGMEQFGKKIPGYTDENAYVIGLESRTSSPVRITRDESFQATIRGLYPCGEGAGYAGGITSAAIDGLKVAEAVASFWKTPESV